MRIEKLTEQKSQILTELFDYNDVEQMILECARDIQKHKIDGFHRAAASAPGRVSGGCLRIQSLSEEINSYDFCIFFKGNLSLHLKKIINHVF